MSLLENKTLQWALRVVQVIFAIIVMGTDGQAIHVYQGQIVDNDVLGETYVDYQGVPSSWGFLMFCALWTILAVIFSVIIGVGSVRRSWIGYALLSTEAIAVLSWFAGFIAVAVNIGSNSCQRGENGCGSIRAATVFGAFEWLLFLATTACTVKLVLGS